MSRSLIAVGMSLAAFTSASEIYGQSTLISLTTRRDMVFDHAGQYLYVSSSDGYVRGYNLSTQQFDRSYNLGGSLNRLDIAPDDSFLLVAQNNLSGGRGVIQRVDLVSGVITNIAYDLARSEAGAWNIAIAANGLAFFTAQYSGGGWVPLRQINLATNSVSTRTDDPGSGGAGTVDQNTIIRRNASAAAFYFLEISYKVGGSLYGADISADDSFLLLGQSVTGLGQGWLQKLDLQTGAVTNLPFNLGISTEYGVWYVAIASNGLAFFTSQNNSGFAPLRQLDLSTNVVSTRTTPGGGSISGGTQIFRSADGSRLFFPYGLEYFTYSTANDTFSSILQANNTIVASAVSRNGLLFGTRIYPSPAFLSAAPTLGTLHTFPSLDSGIAFDGLNDTFYGVSGTTNQVIAYDTFTFAELFRFGLGQYGQSGTNPFGRVLLSPAPMGATSRSTPPHPFASFRCRRYNSLVQHRRCPTAFPAHLRPICRCLRPPRELNVEAVEQMAITPWCSLSVLIR